MHDGFVLCSNISTTVNAALLLSEVSVCEERKSASSRTESFPLLHGNSRFLFSDLYLFFLLPVVLRELLEIDRVSPACCPHYVILCLSISTSQSFVMHYFREVSVRSNDSCTELLYGFR